jgi:hypothetical protein
MARPYSVDLRERVVRAVEAGAALLLGELGGHDGQLAADLIAQLAQLGLNGLEPLGDTRAPAP